MDVVLNLIWLAIVVASAARFAIWAARGDSTRKTAVALATVCILALLFPIISATDDMITNAAYVEEISAVRRTMLANIALVIIPVIVIAAFALVRVAFTAADADPPTAVLDGFGRSLTFRGPPSSLR